MCALGATIGQKRTSQPNANNLMSLFKFFSISALVVGLASGWASLYGLGSGQEAITKTEILFAFGGSLFGAAVIVIFQAAFSGEDFAKRVVSFSLLRLAISWAVAYQL